MRRGLAFGKAAASVPGTDQEKVALSLFAWSLPGTVARNSGSYAELSAPTPPTMPVIL